MNKESDYIEISNTEIRIPIKAKEKWRQRNWETLSANQRKKVYKKHSSMAITPDNIIRIQVMYEPSDFPKNDELSKCISYYKEKLTSYELEFVREKEFIRFRVPFDRIESDDFGNLSNRNDWNDHTNYYEISGGHQALEKYGKLLSRHFSDHPCYERILQAFDFGASLPDRRIQLSGDSRRFKIFFDYDVDLIHTVKKYRAKWDNRRRIWNTPVSMNAVTLAKELRCQQGFKCSREINRLIVMYDSKCLFSYEVSGEQITLRNVAQIEIHTFLAPRKEAIFETETETWIINPNYEISKYLTEVLADKLDQKTIDWLQKFIDSADLLDRHSSNGKIVHEEEDPLPEGLTLIRGERLYTLCRKAKIDYRAAVSFGPRPYTKSIGIFILESDQQKFEDQSNKAYFEHTSKQAEAMARFQANPKRTKLQIHVDATPYNWAFKVLNGSNQVLLTQSGRVTAKTATVNTGEYEALIQGLQWLEAHPCREALLLSDSQTIVRQANGSPVKTTHLEPLRDETQRCLKACSSHTPTSVKWQPGRRNKADAASRHKDYLHSLKEKKSA